MQKREKRRWLFRKPSSHVQQCEANARTNTTAIAPVVPVLAAEHRHAIAVAAATAAAAEAAVATAQAAVEIVRLTRPSSFVREHYAAIVIQTAFRGYLVSIMLVAQYFSQLRLLIRLVLIAATSLSSELVIDNTSIMHQSQSISVIEKNIVTLNQLHKKRSARNIYTFAGHCYYFTYHYKKSLL